MYSSLIKAIVILVGITTICPIHLLSAETATSPNLAPYNLFEKSFEVQLPYQNPYDSSDIQVDAEFVRDGQEKSSVPCFFDGEQGWKVRYTPSRSGGYTYRIRARNRAGDEEYVDSGRFEVSATTSAEDSTKGFVRIGQNTNRFFVFDNGESYFPLGENMGWVHPTEVETWESYFDECAEVGVNWVRIWISPIGATELEWMPNGSLYGGLGKYELRNARMLDGIFKAAEARGIYIQPVINHHGQYSDRTNPIWDQNPYNVKNGGFLETPDKFFTDERAQMHYRDRLRYMVARWGYSTYLMAWEFWNEVDLTSGYDREVVTAWHERMGEYLREIDPYDHLLTTSAAGDHKTTHNIPNMDFNQTHAYVNSIIDKIFEVSPRAAKEHPNKPHFFGELSYDYRGPNKGDKEGVILHNQLWASVHSWDAGTAMTWWWDNWVRPYNLYPVFEPVAKYIEGIHWDREDLQPMKATVEPRPANHCDLVIFPPRGWEKTTRSEFVITPETGVQNLNELSAFVFGQAHKGMSPNPVFMIEADEPTWFGVSIERIAEAGANLIIDVNEGKSKAEIKNEEGVDVSSSANMHAMSGIEKGKNRISISNTGPDWVQIKYYTIKDYAHRIVPYARGGESRILVWVHDSPHQFALLGDYPQYGSTEPTILTLPEITSGSYHLERFDPYTGEVQSMGTVEASRGGLRFDIPSFQRDLAFRLQKQ